MNEKQITIICIVALVLIVLGGAGGWYWMQTYRDDYQKQIKSLEHAIKEGEKKRREWPQIEKDNIALKAKIELVKVRVPDFEIHPKEVAGKPKEYELDRLVNLIDGLRKSSNVFISGGRYTVYQRGAPPAPGMMPLPASVQKATYDFNVRGGWFNLLRFVNMLETQKRILVIESVSVLPGQEATDKDKITATPRRELAVRVSSFMYRVDPAPPAEGAVDPVTGAPIGTAPPPEKPPEPKEKPDTNKSTLPPD
jgi:hypothetical protein